MLMIKGNYEANIIISHLQSVCKSEKEYFFFGYKDDADNFRFDSPCTLSQFNEILSSHNLLCLNSFYVNPYNPSRSEKYLTTFYALHLDLDGWKYETPLSHLNILEKWHELGFDKHPSIIIRTSEGRFHIILWLHPLSAYPDKISYWKKCQKGLCELLKEFRADPQPPVNFVRIPGSINYKYHYKPVVEVVHFSESIFTLTEIHQTLIDNNVFYKKPKRVNISLLQGIKELEMGVPYGMTNYSAWSLALYYKSQGIEVEKTIELLLDWNTKNEVPEERKTLITTIRSAYKTSYELYPGRIFNLVNKKQYLLDNSIPIKLEQTRKTNKNKLYQDRIIKHLQDNNGRVESSLRNLSESLDIPWKSFRTALNNTCFEVDILSKGRNGRAKISLKQADSKYLTLVHSSPNNELDKMGQINGSKPYVYTEEEGVRSKELIN